MAFDQKQHSNAFQWLQFIILIVAILWRQMPIQNIQKLMRAIDQDRPICSDATFQFNSINLLHSIKPYYKLLFLLLLSCCSHTLHALNWKIDDDNAQCVHCFGCQLQRQIARSFWFFRKREEEKKEKERFFAFFVALPRLQISLKQFSLD